MITAVHWDHGHLKGVPFGFTIAFVVLWVLIGIFVFTRLRRRG
jgi:hypothetical protein